MHLTQTVQHAGEHAAHEPLGQLAMVAPDMLLQGTAMLVFHHHVHRIVGAEKILHPHDVRVRQRGQGPAFLEKAFHAVAEGAQVVFGDDRAGLAMGTQGEGVGQVFLDGDFLAVRVASQVDDGKAAERELALDGVLFQRKAAGQGSVGLFRHESRGYDAIKRPLSVVLPAL